MVVNVRIRKAKPRRIVEPLTQQASWTITQATQPTKTTGTNQLPHQQPQPPRQTRSMTTSVWKQQQQQPTVSNIIHQTTTTTTPTLNTKGTFLGAF